MLKKLGWNLIRKCNGFLEKNLPYEMYKKVEIFCRDILQKNRKIRYIYAYFHRNKKNSKEKYCIFRFDMPSYMIFAAGIQYIFAFEYARSKGFIPIVDLEWKYDFQRYRLGKENAWEYCFSQKISIKEALKKDYVLVEQIGLPVWLDRTCLNINGKREDHYLHATEENWRKYYAKANKYVRKVWTFKPEFLSEYQQKYGCQIQEGDCVLGVALREPFSTDAHSKMQKATAKVYSLHPLGPGIKEIVEIVKESIAKWNCNKIFLSTMYRDSLEIFKKEFGDKVIYISRERGSLEDYSTSPDTFGMDDKELYKYMKSKPGYPENSIVPYVQEIIGLSSCDYLLAAKSSGAIAALAINGGKYKDIHILEDENHINRY